MCNRAADILSLLHLVVVLIAAFGWWLLPGSWFHFLVLAGTWTSWVFFGSCILSRAEFWLRDIPKEESDRMSNGYLHFHMHRWVRYAPSHVFIRAWGLLYLSAGIALWAATNLEVLV